MKKKLLTPLLLLALVFSLIACGTDEKSNIENNTGEQTQEDPPSAPPADDYTAVAEDNTVNEESAKDTNTEKQEVVEPDEPVAEMVDFETWAKQAEHDEVCMVVWNDITGTQQILEPVMEDGFVYTVQDGDRFAIPKRSNIDYILVGYDTKLYPGSEEKPYFEIALPVGKIMEVHIICSDQINAISYWFNY